MHGAVQAQGMGPDLLPYLGIQGNDDTQRDEEEDQEAEFVDWEVFGNVFLQHATEGRLFHHPVRLRRECDVVHLLTSLKVIHLSYTII